MNSLQRLALQIKCLKQVIEWCDLFQKELSFTYLSSEVWNLRKCFFVFLFLFYFLPFFFGFCFVFNKSFLVDIFFYFFPFNFFRNVSAEVKLHGSVWLETQIVSFYLKLNIEIIAVHVKLVVFSLVCPRPLVGNNYFPPKIKKCRYRPYLLSL